MMTDPVPSIAPAFSGVRLLAFYLPQFHPIPENDLWWGQGFTEWRTATSARPLFRGHEQPRIPADLGFYDLRVDEVRVQQAELALQNGIAGFIYWHYWLHGKELLGLPLSAMLKQRDVRIPFCVAWANHDWTRRWVGGEAEIVLPQRYSAADDLHHIRSLRPVLEDDRYITYDGSPVVFVYRLHDLPNPRQFAETWRSVVEGWGFPGLYLVALESAPTELLDPREHGFDAAMQHEPAWWSMPRSPIKHLVRRKLQRLRGRSYPVVVRYSDFVDQGIERSEQSLTVTYPRWPGVTVGFDNTPRYGHRSKGLVIDGVQVAEYRRWLRVALKVSSQVALSSGRVGVDEAMIGINAWNEWGETMCLEPDVRRGRKLLTATREELLGDA